jgi:nucleotide-binding universal stress UspA family protein
MLGHFLIVIDTVRLADEALAHTIGLARAADAHITLMRLLNPPMGRSRMVDPVEWHIRKIEAETSLNEIGQNIRKMGVQVQTTILESQQPEHVLQYAQTRDVDMLIIAGQPEGVGDLVHNLMKRTRIPILVLRVAEKTADASECYRKILVPLDGSQRAEYTLPLAAGLAQRCDAQLVLAHVVRKPEMPRRAAPPPEDTELVERLVESSRIEAVRYLEQTAARLPGEVETRLLVNDSVTSALHNLIEQEGIDLIVLSAHGNSGAPQYPYGSIANSLIAYSHTPVLVVQDLPSAEMTSTEAEARSGKVR